MENVFGLAYRNQSSAFLQRLINGIQRLGYSAHYEVLNAADFGVPQNRQRLFLIGSRDGRRLRPSATDALGRARTASAPRLGCWSPATRHGGQHVLKDFKGCPNKTNWSMASGVTYSRRFHRAGTTCTTRLMRGIRPRFSSGGPATGRFCSSSIRTDQRPPFRGNLDRTSDRSIGRIVACVFQNSRGYKASQMPTRSLEHAARYSFRLAIRSRRHCPCRAVLFNDNSQGIRI